jgi:hypothetical protein
MPRSLCTACLAALLATLGAWPAPAQFNNPFEALFGRPPRPPSEVPTVRQPPQYPPQQYPHPPPQYPPEPYQSEPQRPYPPQANVPLRNPPGIQSEPLPPPPGGTAAVDPRAPLAQPPGYRPPPPADTSVQPGDEVITAPPSQKIVNKSALFSGLDKITGRIINFDVAIGETVQFGALQVTPRACYTRPPTETPNTDGFIEVDEVTLQGEVKRIFTGWMFAASPGLHGVEHPIYDIWLSDCKSPVVAAAPAPEEPTATPPPKPAAKPPAAPKRPAARPQPPQQQGWYPPR